MAVDRSFIERNRASTQRIRALAERLKDEEMRTPLGEHWTISMMFVHMSFWDRRALLVLEKTEQDGRLNTTGAVDMVVNDIMLPVIAAVPPREAARIVVETADALDRKLETYPPALLEEVYACYDRWVERYWHRNVHLDEAEAALKI